MSVTDSDSVAQDQLQAFVRRIESLEDEINALNGDKSEVYKEAKGNGFDTKVLRKVIADRRKDASERNEFDAVYQLYWDAVHGHVRAHVENIDEFTADALGITAILSYGVNGQVPEHDPETGEIHEPDAALRPQTGGVETPAISEPSEMTSSDPLRSVAATREDADTGGSEPTNVTPLHRFNPATHFANSKGIPRLHGCVKPEACGGSHRALCFSCERMAHGAAQGGAA